MKPSLTLLSLVLTAAFTGCTITVRPNDGGGGDFDSGGGSDSAGMDDGGHDDGGGFDDGASENPPPRRRRVVRRGPVIKVGAYRHLPRLGPTKKYMIGLGDKINMDRGLMHGDMKLYGNGFHKKGAGKGQTVVRGDLRIKGNNWVLMNFTVTGNVRIHGQNNDLSRLEIHGRVEKRGPSNKTP